MAAKYCMNSSTSVAANAVDSSTGSNRRGPGAAGTVSSAHIDRMGVVMIVSTGIARSGARPLWSARREVHSTQPAVALNPLCRTPRATG
jgi:hypothetical protein